MSNNYNIIKKKNYNHLSLPEREIIDSMLHFNKKQSEIALVINRDKSTVSRELNRNSSNIYNCYKDHIDHPNYKTNYESIYQYIYYENQNMIKYLPQSHKKRKKRYSAKNKRAIRI